MKKEEAIELYMERYLDGKSEDKRREFMEKDVDRKYAAIMAWKRRSDIKAVAEGIYAKDLLKHIRSLQKLIPLAVEMTDKDVALLSEELAKVQETLADYRRQQNLKELQRLEQESDALQQRIRSLREKC